MNIDAFNTLADQVGMSTRNREIAERHLVAKEPIKQLGKEYGLSYQRISAIKRQILEVLNQDPVQEFDIAVTDLIQNAPLPLVYRQKIIAALRECGLKIMVGNSQRKKKPK